MEYAYICVCLRVCVCRRVLCCVGGLVAVGHSFLISVSFAPQALWSREIYSVLRHVTHMYVNTLPHTHTLLHTNTLTISLPLSTVPFGEWSQSADTAGSQLCPPCLGVTVTEFLFNCCLQTADRHNPQVVAAPAHMYIQWCGEME